MQMHLQDTVKVRGWQVSVMVEISNGCTGVRSRLWVHLENKYEEWGCCVRLDHGAGAPLPRRSARPISG